MSQLLETIKIENGRVCHLEWHQARMDFARRKAFGSLKKIGLKDSILVPMECQNGVFKCRILYQKSIERIEYQSYSARVPRSFKCVDGSHLNYDLKWADRSGIDALFKRRGVADDIIIVRKGKITDTSYANLAFYDGKKWITPTQPLLAGTCRARLIFENKIVPSDIFVHELGRFSKIKILNAMGEWAIDFPEIIL